MKQEEYNKTKRSKAITAKPMLLSINREFFLSDFIRESAESRERKEHFAKIFISHSV